MTQLKAAQFINHTIRVCNLCFTLVEKESQLIGIERKLVEMQGITIAPVNNNMKAAERPVLLDPSLHQYRVMFYFVKMIGNIMSLKPKSDDSTILIEVRMFEVPSSFTLQFCYKLKKYDTESMFSSKSRSPTLKNVDITYNGSANLNYLRFFYFYSLQTDVDEFLKSCQLEVSIFEEIKNKPNKLLGRSYIKALENFIICDKNEFTRDGFATRHTISVKLFLKDLNTHFDIPIIAGIVYDGVKNTKNVSLKKFEDFKIYYPSYDYFTSDLIPSEWMEIFTSGISKKFYTSMAHYEPNLSPSEFELEPKPKKRALTSATKQFKEIKEIKSMRMSGKKRMSSMLSAKSSGIRSSQYSPTDLLKGMKMPTTHRNKGFGSIMHTSPLMTAVFKTTKNIVDV